MIKLPLKRMRTYQEGVYRHYFRINNFEPTLLHNTNKVMTKILGELGLYDSFRLTVSLSIEDFEGSQGALNCEDIGETYITYKVGCEKILFCINELLEVFPDEMPYTIYYKFEKVEN